MNSQDSGTPTDQDIPTATPATSTPKPRSFQTVTPAHMATSTRTPSSSASRGAMRPTLMFSSNGEPQSATRKASLAVNTIVLGGKSRVVTTAQTTPLKTVQNAPERSNGKTCEIQHMSHKQATAKSAGSKSQTRPQVRQTKKVNELNVKKIDVQVKQPSKQSMKKTQKSNAAVKKSAPPPPPSKRSEGKAATAKPAAKSTSTKSVVKKSIHQIPDSPDPYDIHSPVLGYNLLTEEGHATIAAKKQNTSSGSGHQTVGGTSKTTLFDVTNQSHGATQLNRGGQHRVFNLSAAPQKRSKSGRGKTVTNSATSSLSSSPCLDDVNAIPDSMPACGQSSQKSMAYTSILDDELELRPPTTSKQRKRVRVPTDHDSFTFDSDNESDESWKLSGDAKRGKVAASKPPTKKRQYKAKAIKEKPKPTLTSARTKKVMADKKQQSVKAIATSKATTSKVVKRLEEDVENIAKKARPPAGTSLLGRKRVIDDVYDPDFTPEFNCPKPKITAAAAAAVAKKGLPKKKAAPRTSTVAAKITTEEPAKETPSLPSMKKDTAVRKLVMIQCSPKQSGARKRGEIAKEEKKKQQTSRNGKKKCSTQTVDAPHAHDDLYYSPAIPRVSASKPDLAERAQSHSKPQGPESPKLVELYSPELDLHEDDDALVCPPSPKKPRLKQRGRRSSGYFSDACSHAPSSPPEYSDHGSLEELQDNIKTNLQFAENESEHSCSQSPSSSCPSSPPPQHQQATKVPSLPPSPTSLHSSQVEADLNVTSNFEQICRQFISRSGKTGHQPSSATRKQTVKRTKSSENVATVAKKKRKEQKTHWEDEDEERNSPPRQPPAVKVSIVSFLYKLYVRLCHNMFLSIDSPAKIKGTSST